MFLLFNSTKPAPLSMNELTAEYGILMRSRISLEILRNSKYQNPRDKNRNTSFLKEA